MNLLSEKRREYRILEKIYDLSNIRVYDNGSWEIEQSVNDNMVFTARILRNGDIYVTVEVEEQFRRLITEYRYDE